MMTPVILLVALCGISYTSAAGTVCTSTVQTSCKAAASSGCTESPSTHFWCVPCLSNAKISLTSILAKQNGNTIDANGGINIKQPMYLTAYGSNSYGRIANPKVDVTVEYCGKSIFSGGSCKWNHQPTLGLTDNLNPCSSSSGVTITPDCHLSSGITQISMTIDLSKNALLSPFLALLNHGDYYQLIVTLKDGSTPVFCVDAAAKLL